jgi:hypothetical protein
MLDKPIIYKAIFGIALEACGKGAMKLWPDIIWLGWPLMLGGIALFTWALWDFIFSYLKWTFWPNWTFGCISPFRVLVPLDIAARKAVNATIKNGSRVLNILNWDDGDLRFVHMANHMLPYGKIYGKIDGLDFYEEIPEDEWSHISRDCKTTTDNGRKVLHYDLKIERSALKKYLRELKNENR